MSSKRDFHKAIIGRSELVSFVDLGLTDIPAKTDTGAYRSAIHASSIELRKDGVLSFDVLKGHPLYDSHGTHVETSDFQKRLTGSSSGHRERRFIVKLKVRLGSKVVVTSFSLADRSTRKYPVLLGRTLISDRFLVDTSETSIDASQLKQMHGQHFNIDEEAYYETLRQKGLK